MLKPLGQNPSTPLSLYAAPPRLQGLWGFSNIAITRETATVETIRGKREMIWHQVDTTVGCEWQMYVCNNQHMQMIRSVVI